jgi:hypothetical protein
VRLRPATWGKLALGTLVIGGTFALLWAIYRPLLPWQTGPEELPGPPVLHRASATVEVSLARSAAVRRARITCDGKRRVATGFWAADAYRACDALASTRSALLAGPGCARTRRDRVRLHVVGAFGDRRVDHRMQEFGCPNHEDWLHVNALALPVLIPQREAKGKRSP